jgi:hypothetical protein
VIVFRYYIVVGSPEQHLTPQFILNAISSDTYIQVTSFSESLCLSQMEESIVQVMSVS